ncbi:MAG: NAD+ synthase [Nitrospirae bacterium]|nr:NAD+ synthase [Nitrospirota bacterium]
MKKIRIALAQINPVVGDLDGNVKKIISYIKKARTLRSDIVAFPELAITGYPPEDLLLKQEFIEDNVAAMHKVRKASQGITVIAGFVDRKEGHIFNAAAILSHGKLIDVYHKKHLPNYGVFDEFRYFRSGNRYPLYSIDGIKFSVNIMGKAKDRESLVSARAREYKKVIAYVNMVGGQDELVFDGGSFMVNNNGGVVLRGKQFKEEILALDIEVETVPEKNTSAKQKELKALVCKGEILENLRIPVKLYREKKPALKTRTSRKLLPVEEVYSALVMGTRDYVIKNGFSDVVIGLSGGVDSSLVAAIAVDAIGRDRVKGLFMPSKYTSRESYEDAGATAKNLGMKIITVPINQIHKTHLKTLSEHFKGTKENITEENLQARIRGNILMAFSNKFGWLVLTTGNKSEMSVGYATLYGDMAGGFAVIKDVPKTMVYELCKWKNDGAGRFIIPERVLWKEPTAELRPDQRDTDTLPPYPVLDPILKAYVEEDRSFEEIINTGCDKECAKKVVRMIDHSEYKRRQAPPGIKITPRAFGKDRRFPITNRYKSY